MRDPFIIPDYAIIESRNTKIFLDCLISKTNHRQYVYERDNKHNNKLLSGLKRKCEPICQIQNIETESLTLARRCYVTGWGVGGSRVDARMTNL